MKNNNTSTVSVSLIITTFNWEKALELSFLSAIDQTLPPDEIIIADDGSGPSTRAMVQKLAGLTEIPVIHSWQKDKGFRAARCRNKAIRLSTSDYLIFIDGDVIIEKNFIADHVKFSKPKSFIQGSRVIMNEEASRRILKNKIKEVSFFDKGMGNRKNCIRSNILSKIFSNKNKSLNGIKTCNFSLWREDAVKVNGFNEEFVGWGSEDTEFSARLFNSGLVRQSVKFHALAYHLYHHVSPKDPLRKNHKILTNTLNNRLQWCDSGLDQHF